MQNVLIIGSNGMLGYMVKNILSKDSKINIISTSRKKTKGGFIFDIKEGIIGLEKIFENQKQIDFVINCTGVLNNEIYEGNLSSKENAIIVNSLFPVQLGILAEKYETKVIQISTDGVFAIDSKVCTEQTLSNCNDIYGKTKYLGEIESANYLNIRCSIIGPSPYRKRGLFEWVVNQPKNANLNGFSNQRWNGVTTLQYASLIHEIIKNDYFRILKEQSSTHHFCPNITLSKYDLLILLKEIFRPDLNIISLAARENAIERELQSNYNTLGEIFGNNIPMRIPLYNLLKEIDFKK